ncbi:MAG TPA: dihydroorotate dehydrogenase electron transfer subunit [Candidatus Omnitrophota bacterium]|nr:dihydroorotate dehydrogenase electron transfer subunit [Candidatus Omnitrophota bacterium]HQJ16196.1 dihydroorotate dehydrogenase electron transfer subunit [Candidatus Omnitrophota bacterium]
MSALQTDATIKANGRVAHRFSRIVLEAPELSRTARPGNFVMVKVPDAAGALLRRPLSIHKAEAGRGRIELLYEIVGPGTCALSRKKAGESINVIGPLGNGFDFHSQQRDALNILVAGGIGVAPLVFLAQRLKKGKMLALIGARTAAHILCAADFRKLGCAVRIATDDGSAGLRGRVTDLLVDVLMRREKDFCPVLYGCGPKPMLEAIARVCRENRMQAQVSLEAHMACGIGACLGCVVQTTRGYERVCKEGPVFRIDDLVW